MRSKAESKRFLQAKFEMTTFGRLTRSCLMARVCSRGNKTTELRMLRLLRQGGVKGWRRHARMPGKPDFSWPKERFALFIDGCFWHGHRCARNLKPKRNASFWRNKVYYNRKRDRLVTQFLKKRGWAVARIWECRLKRRPSACLRLVVNRLAERGGADRRSKRG